MCHELGHNSGHCINIFNKFLLHVVVKNGFCATLGTLWEAHWDRYDDVPSCWSKAVDRTVNERVARPNFHTKLA